MNNQLLRTFERNNYFFGKLLTVRDFGLEQEYHRDKVRLHTRFLHDWGVVCGLRVRSAGNPEFPWRWVLEPGLAIDACGREIIVSQPCEFDLQELLKQAGLLRLDPKQPLYLALAYHECEAEAVPVYAREQCAPQADCAPNRIIEGYSIGFTTEAPMPAVAQLCEAVKQAFEPKEGQLLPYQYIHTLDVGPEGACSVAAMDMTKAAAGSFMSELYHVTRDTATMLPVKLTDNPLHVASGAGNIWAGFSADGVAALKLNADGTYAVQTDKEQQVLDLGARHKGDYAYMVVADGEDATAVSKITAAGVVGARGALDPKHNLPADLKPREVAVTPDDKWLVIAAYHTGENQHQIAFWNIAKGAVEHKVVAGHPAKDLRTHFDGDSLGVLYVTADAAYYMDAQDQPLRQIFGGHKLVCGTLQGNFAFLGGISSDDGQWTVWVCDLTGNAQPMPIHLEEGAVIHDIDAGPAESLRVYVATSRGVAIIEAEREPAEPVDLYRVLCEQSMACPTCDPCTTEAVVLGRVTLGDEGLPMVNACDGRRIVLNAGQLTALFSCLAQAVAKAPTNNPLHRAQKEA
jgi:hypothetical protein